MRRILFIFTLALGAIFSSFLFMQDLHGTDTSERGEHISLENAIIIQGLQMESAIPQQELDNGDIDGSIIYDDAFDAGMRSIDKSGNNNKAGMEDNRESYIKKLRKTDPRWHISRYVIKNNDNLWTIAERHGISHNMILELNRIEYPDMLRRGKVIFVPSRKGVYHTVRTGECLTHIARRYGVGINAIKTQNVINGNRIYASMKLFIPDASLEMKSSTSVHKITRNKIDASNTATQARLNLIWPLHGRVTSGFGNRRDPFVGRRMFHCGIDISANPGVPIKAAKEGKVIFSGWKTGYGNMVILRHDYGYITVYAHNSKNTVVENNTVAKGGIIGYSGSTGAVTGAHLHFEVRKYLTPLNPMRFIR